MWPKTLADDPAECRKHLADELQLDQDTRTARVVAPCCGARVPADCVRDVRGIPGTIVSAADQSRPRDHAFLCDRCVALLFGDAGNDWLPSRLARAAGAPADAIRFLRARELADEDARECHQRDGHAEPHALLETAMARLPKRRRAIEGTEAPGASGRLRAE